LRRAALSIRLAGARVAAAALFLPVLLGAGGVPAVATHSMSPADGGLVGYQAIGDAQSLGLVRFPCQSPAAPFPCYGPDQIRAAYDIQPLLNAGVTGAGQTIVIVDAFQSPSLSLDLTNFDAVWGLPAANLDIVAPDGLTPFDGSRLEVGWAIEISLDVEWAHVVAPGAHIELVLAKSEKDADMLRVTEYAIDHHLGNVITQSFGESEACADPKLLRQEHAAFDRAAARGITLLAGSGDFGATNLLCDGSGIATVASASTPASDPNVTAVGGTRLVADPVSGAYGSESGWGDVFGASGGGFSSLYQRPGYQAPFLDEHKARGLPDVAYSADAFGRAIIAFGGGFGTIFGTSVGTPQWAGIAALSSQRAGHRQPSFNDRLYSIASGEKHQVAFHDITSGSNSFAGVTGFSAGRGWDAVTGLGSPDVAKLVRLLSEGDD
jgi:subtilase family serine protease